MSKTKVDIDTLLGEDQLELKVGDNIFVIKDVSLETYLAAIKLGEEDPEGTDPRIIHKQLARMFNVDVSELSHLGFRAALACLEEVSKWINNQSDTLGGGDSDAVNP